MPVATTASTADTTKLALPRAAYAKISPSPFLAAHLLPVDPAAPSIRPNGRSPAKSRAPACQTGSLTHCAGSAVVRNGDTAVVCGIQAEILLATDIPHPPHVYDPTNTRAPQDAAVNELAQLNLLVPNVELASGCSPQHLPGAGGPPSLTAQTLAQRLLALLLSSRLIGIKDLEIRHTPVLSDDDDTQQPEEQVIAYWTLYPSVHVMSLDGESSLLDVAWAAMLAALRDVRLPRAYWDADREMILCSDLRSEAAALNLHGRPFACTWGVYVAHEQQVQALEQQRGSSAQALGKALPDGKKAWLLADPDDFEDQLCREVVQVVVDCSRAGPPRIIRLEKYGGSVVGAAETRQIVEAAASRWKQWAAAIPWS